MGRFGGRAGGGEGRRGLGMHAWREGADTEHC